MWQSTGGYALGMREKEAKFELEESSELPAPGTLVKGLGEYSVDEIRQNADYYDTVDLRLTRAGASLRFRSDDGWTVKLPKQQHGLLERDEFVLGFSDPGSPPAEAVSLVRALTRSRPLNRIATVRTDRREVRIEDSKGRAVGLIDDDRVRTTAPGALARSFHEVEFEIADGADSGLVAKVITRLRDAGARPNRQRPKIVRALGKPARRAPDVEPGDPLGRTSTPADLAQSCLANSVHRLVTHDPVVRTDSDPEGVHKARVATRRLRSDLRTLRPVLQTARTEPLRKELKWLGESLGSVRDADVLQGLLASKLAVLPAACGDDAAQIEKELERQRATELANLGRALDSSRYLAVLDELVSVVHEPPLDWSRRDPTRTDAAVVKKVANKQWKRFRKAVDRLPRDPSDQELHEVRKRAKQARYAFEAAAPIIGKSARRLSKRLSDLQDHLGALQDAVMAADWLHEAALRVGGASNGYVAGRIAQAFDTDRRDLRRSWKKEWKRARRAHRRL
jgi:CHAD domain-containing protein